MESEIENFLIRFAMGNNWGTCNGFISSHYDEIRINTNLIPLFTAKFDSGTPYSDLCGFIIEILKAKFPTFHNIYVHFNHYEQSLYGNPDILRYQRVSVI